MHWHWHNCSFDTGTDKGRLAIGGATVIVDELPFALEVLQRTLALAFALALAPIPLALARALARKHGRAWQTQSLAFLLALARALALALARTRSGNTRAPTVATPSAYDCDDGHAVMLHCTFLGHMAEVAVIICVCSSC